MEIKKEIFRKLIWLSLALVGIWLLFIRPELNISKLKSYGVETKAIVYRKSAVGSKGTIRCFYKFMVQGNEYEGFYDNEKINQGDSIVIVYYAKEPSLNQSKQFVLNY